MISERAVPMQGIHTNNFTEAYHRVLKYNFLSRHTLRRPDDTIQVLVDTAEPEFRQTVITTSLGFRPQRSTKYQNIAKGLADSYTDEDLSDLGVVILKEDKDKWRISSFTRPFALTYDLTTTLPKDGSVGYVNNCRCAHYVQNKSACKHMYVLARRTNFKIYETDAETDDGHSLFVPRGITTPFNLVVNVMTSVHPDSPPPSPPLNPYRSSSGLAQTPSTSGLPPGTFQYAPMVPAPIPPSRTPREEPISPQHDPPAPDNASASLTSGEIDTSTRTTFPRAVHPDTSSRWLPESTYVTPGRTEPVRHPYAGRVSYDPYYLQSTPPTFALGPSYVPPFASGIPPYPLSPFVRMPAPRALNERSMEFASYNSLLTNSCIPTPHGAQAVEPRPSYRHHPYLRHNPPDPNESRLLPPVPPPTQLPYALDPYSLHRHLESYAPQRPLHHSAPSQPTVRTPEVTPAPVTTSQLDGLFQAMEAGRDRHAVRPQAHDSLPSTRSRSHHSATPTAVPPGPYDGIPLTQRTSHPMENTDTHQSIDQGPSFLTEMEVDAMNATELQFYKKKDDLHELLKILRQINAEAPFNDEAGILNRVSPALMAAMRSRATEFLTTLRSFNSNNRTSKQRR
ncbi:hypothetical protein DFH28DRAFT_919389 [Melampsora americana]|nr:hypothetical protein DFH28DRAFT_919389 [Melampsora americana]